MDFNEEKSLPVVMEDSLSSTTAAEQVEDYSG
jgi:hypothetical protein